jgi:N-acetylglucosamine-6-phosphate deacetylase
MLSIDHATLYTPDDMIVDGAILIDGDRIVACGPAAEVAAPANATHIDAQGASIAPGFIDLQLNGALGDDFTQDPATIWRVAAQLPRWGCTAFLPTIITSPLATVEQAQAVLAAGPPPGWRGALPLGLHVEGPFLNPKKKGAHNPAHLRLPNLEHVAAWAPAQQVRLVTLAPELEGALEVTAALAARGVVVSAGHSMATFAQAQAGFAAGARYGTHIFNAMPTLEHRAPGLPGALLTTPGQVVGLIPDGVHTHPAIVALVWQMKGAAGLTLVTDAMAALGMPPGKYMLGDQEVTVTESDARLPSGTLAGSVLAMNEALRCLLRFTGCSLHEALPTITSTPARVLGLTDHGRLAPGAIADLVFLDDDLEVVRTLAAGIVVFERNERN